MDTIVIGTGLGPYRLTAPVGRGAMGTVWAAVHAETELPVAVKVVGGAVDRPAFAASFRDEVRAVAALDHPNVVLVHDHGEIDARAAAASRGRLQAGAPWLAMEWASEGTLASTLPRRWSSLRDLLLALLDALAHAHARGVVHRDLKPANVLLCAHDDPRPGPKLADFGIARLLDDAAADSVAGTPMYMAPEQAVRGARIGPWTDLYALGAMAWEISTGSAPFGGRDPKATIRAHRSEPLPRFRPRFPVPSGFEAWVTRLLAKAPADRFPMSADARWALGRLGDAPDLAAGESTSRTVDTWSDTGTPTAFETDTDETTDASFPASEVTAVTPTVPTDWRGADTGRGAPLRGAGLGLYGLRAVPLVDRETERDALWAALRAVRADRKPRAVVVRGPAGAGKSRLCEWLGQRAHETGAAHLARATHGPDPAPLDGPVGLVMRILGAAGAPRERVEERVAAWLGPHPDPWLAGGLRGLLGLVPEDRQSPRERHRVVAAVLERLTRDRPAIVWLDDVQWGPAALGLAAYLLEAAPRPPVVLVLTAREEALPERPDEAAALDRLPAVRLDVGPLAPEHRRRLVQELLGLEGSVAAAVEDRTAGNPLFAVQLVGDWVQRGLLVPGARGFHLRDGAAVDLPDGLHAMWSDRIERLLADRPAGDGPALELAAVLGVDVDPTEWRGACEREGLSPSEGLVDALIGLRLAVGGPEATWSFVNAMLRESLERRAEDRLPGHHAAAAAVLPSASALQRERRGRHLLAAGHAEEAFPELLAGAMARHDRGEVDVGLRVVREAERALGDAMDDRRGDVWLMRGSLLTRRGAASEAEALAQQVVGAGWPQKVPRALEQLGIAARQRGELARSAELLALAEAKAHAAGLAYVACNARAARAATAHAAGRHEEAITYARAALEEGEENGWWDPVHQGAYWLGMTELQAGRLDEAELALQKVRAACEAASYRPGVLECITVLGDVARHRGDLALAEQRYAEARGHATAMESGGLAVVELNLGLVLVERGRHAQAVGPLRHCAEAFAANGRRVFAGATGLLLAACAAAAGDRGGWEALAPEAIATLRASGVVYSDIARCAELAADAALAAGWVEAERDVRALAVEQRAALGPGH